MLQHKRAHSDRGSSKAVQEETRELEHLLTMRLTTNVAATEAELENVKRELAGTQAKMEQLEVQHQAQFDELYDMVNNLKKKVNMNLSSPRLGQDHPAVQLQVELQGELQGEGKGEGQGQGACESHGLYLQAKVLDVGDQVADGALVLIFGVLGGLLDLLSVGPGGLGGDLVLGSLFVGGLLLEPGLLGGLAGAGLALPLGLGLALLLGLLEQLDTGVLVEGKVHSLLQARNVVLLVLLACGPVLLNVPLVVAVAAVVGHVLVEPLKRAPRVKRVPERIELVDLGLGAGDIAHLGHQLLRAEPALRLKERAPRLKEIIRADFFGLGENQDQHHDAHGDAAAPAAALGGPLSRIGPAELGPILEHSESDEFAPKLRTLPLVPAKPNGASSRAPAKVPGERYRASAPPDPAGPGKLSVLLAIQKTLLRPVRAETSETSETSSVYSGNSGNSSSSPQSVSLDSDSLFAPSPDGTSTPPFAPSPDGVSTPLFAPQASLVENMDHMLARAAADAGRGNLHSLEEGERRRQAARDKRAEQRRQ